MSSTIADQVDLGDRRLYIGGSDIGAIMGRNKYRSPVQVYYEKLGETQEFQGNEATHWGHILEAVIAAEYARREGVKVVRDRRLFKHPEFSYMLGHIDRRILNIPGGKGLEVKTAGKWFKPKDWEDEPPVSYQLQCQWYMMLTGWESFDLVALLAGQDFRTYPIERNGFVIQEAMEAAREFWSRIQERNPPPPMSEEDCKLLWSLDNQETAIAGDEQESMVKTLAQVQAQIKELEEQEKTLKVALMEFMRPRAYLVDIAGNKLVSWKNNQELDLDKLAAEQSEALEPFYTKKLDVTAFKKANAKLAKQYTKQSETRVFRLA